MRGDDFNFHWPEFDNEPENVCPKCGEIVPLDHLETDTGVCISCEDAEAEEDGASGIETEGRDRADGHGAEHDSPTAESGDAQDKSTSPFKSEGNSI